MPSLARCFSLSDFIRRSKSQVPFIAFDYIHRGSGKEITLKNNTESFNDYTFNPRILINVDKVKLNSTIMGVESSMPFAIAPTGMSRLFHWEGERAVIRAAEKACIPYSLSTVATTSIEDITKESPSTPKFFQIYIWKNRKWVYELLERCKQNKFKGFMLAVDFPTLGNRIKDKKNGHGTKLLRRNMALAALSKPKWLFNFLIRDSLKLANLGHVLPHQGEIQKNIDEVNNQFDASLEWKDALELKNRAEDFPFFLKGIQSVEDALLAKENGFKGIILSNHGGRQLDSAPTSLELVPLVREAVGPKFEIIIDGGITCGSDIIKALCLGADSCLIGKAYLYGLAAGGEAGVSKVLSIFKEEMERSLRLIGCPNIKDLNPSYLRKI